MIDIVKESYEEDKTYSYQLGLGAESIPDYGLNAAALKKAEAVENLHQSCGVAYSRSFFENVTPQVFFTIWGT